MLRKTFSSEELATLNCQEILDLVATGEKSLVKTFRMKKISLFSRFSLWFFGTIVCLSHRREIRCSEKLHCWYECSDIEWTISNFVVRKWPGSAQGSKPQETEIAPTLINVQCNLRFGEIVRALEFLREAFPGRIIFLPVGLNVFETLAPYAGLLNELDIEPIPVYSPNESDPDELQQVAQEILHNALERSVDVIDNKAILAMLPMSDFEFNPDTIQPSLFNELQSAIPKLTLKTLCLSSKTGKNYKISLFRHYLFSLQPVSL